MDQKDSVNAVLFFADSFTWPEALRSFMQAEAELYAEPLELMTSLAPEYPMAPSEKIVESRVKILSFLVDQVRTVIGAVWEKSPFRSRFGWRKRS